MRKRLRSVPLLVGVVGALVLAGTSLVLPFEVRNSAIAGYTQTLDPQRGIAVSGARVTVNYPDLRRIDLDLRGYTRPARFDITLHVRPAEPGAADVRTVPLSVSGEEIWHQKEAFADPFTRVRFPAIAESAGRRYDIWIETGPRNRDDILALWSIKTYSRTTGREVLAAFLDDPPGSAAQEALRVVLASLLVALVGAFGWLLGGATSLALAAWRSIPAAPPPVAPGRGRWYTLGRFGRWPVRPPPSGTRRDAPEGSS